MAKFSKKRFEKFISNKSNVDQVAKGYIAHGGMMDRRSKSGISKATKKRALKKFEKDLEGRMLNNPELTQSEATKQLLRSQQYNIYADIAKENWRNTLKEAGINVQMRSLEFVKTGVNNSPIYRITRGKNAGKYTVLMHLPGQTPSFQIMLLDSI